MQRAKGMVFLVKGGTCSQSLGMPVAQSTRVPDWRARQLPVALNDQGEGSRRGLLNGGRIVAKKKAAKKKAPAKKAAKKKGAKKK